MERDIAKKERENERERDTHTRRKEIDTLFILATKYVAKKAF